LFIQIDPSQFPLRKERPKPK